MKTEIEAKVRNMISNQMEVFPETIDLEMDMQKDLELDDIEMTLLMLAVEDEFGFKVPPDDERQLKTGQDIVEYIIKRQFSKR